MKLIVAIIHNDDSMAVTSALTRENYNVTKLSTTGGFLLVGNTTLLIGSEDDRVARAKEIIQEYSHTRRKRVSSSETLGVGLQNDGLAQEVRIAGATVFVLSVDSMDKY